ncbi:Protein OAC-37 [Aphelenchoides avenae]|nr:Protein OAC-37 [Aphelenchus avenae]
MAADKRQDIQGLRAVAIVAVLLFHVWPTLFPNGYLGVDMFFVLSGYLMAAVLSRVSEVNRSNIVQFYYRRVKRIVPLCLVVLNVTVAFALWRFWRLVSSFHVKFIRDMVPAYFFATNVANILEDEDYFELTDQYRFFKHCWSLGVEMQFYLVIPFVFLGIRNLRRPAVVSICLTIIALSMYTQVMASPIVAFNFTWCRIWQLMSGVSAHLFFAVHKPVKIYERLPQINGELEKKGSSPATSHAPCQVPTTFTVSATAVAFLVILLLFNPVPRLVEIQAQLVVFMASGLLVAGSRHTIYVLSSSALTYIGDISYVLYLVHWPIIQFWKYETAQKGFGFAVLSFVLVLYVIGFSLRFAHLTAMNSNDSEASAISGNN